MTEVDSLVGKLTRFLVARLAINTVRIRLAVMNSPRLFRKPATYIIAIRLDLLAQLDQGPSHPGDRNRWAWVARAPEPGGHDCFLDGCVAAMWTCDFGSFLLGVKSAAVSEPSLELMATGTAQRKQNHRNDLLAAILTPPKAHLAILGAGIDNAEWRCAIPIDEARGYDRIVVTNYPYRSLLPEIGLRRHRAS